MISGLIGYCLKTLNFIIVISCLAWIIVFIIIEPNLKLGSSFSKVLFMFYDLKELIFNFFLLKIL
ncbi:hypothetical protein Bmayo_04255 (plasmid) [Borreliella mayonii]|uniref:Uncharacterized protein n=1 Tax=Borreliella mayonii TaxID=1674146 RepID=A0AAC9KXJ3_9SPIR|nr:hypothetical protein A7X70_05960 [Borreliella mayonii]APT00455.1 hypothetical protein Bmayo_04255 [Borreliella mayonii]